MSGDHVADAGKMAGADLVGRIAEALQRDICDHGKAEIRDAELSALLSELERLRAANRDCVDWYEQARAEAERLRADAARLTAAAAMVLDASSRMTAFGDGRAYFESGDAVNAFRSALRAIDAAMSAEA